METIILHSDNGAVFEFQGQLFSETSFYDEHSQTLTRLRLFISSTGKQVYSIVIAGKKEKQRRCYSLVPQGDMCDISDGRQTLKVPVDLLFASVFGLCGIDPARAADLKATFDETIKLAIA